GLNAHLESPLTCAGLFSGVNTSFIVICLSLLDIEGQTVAIGELFIYKKYRAVTEYKERTEELHQVDGLYGVVERTIVAGPNRIMLRQYRQFLWIIRKPYVDVDHMIGSNTPEGTEEMEIDNEGDTPDDEHLVAGILSDMGYAGKNMYQHSYEHLKPDRMMNYMPLHSFNQVIYT
ncbi:hypothetical protein FRC03_005314, partial [Tulasnella sp. 419]